MTFKRIFSSLLLALVLLAIPGSALGAPSGQPPLDDRVIFGDNYTLASGETIDGNLVVFGGNVTVEQGATVTASVICFGGNVTLDGSVGEDVVVVGGNMTLGPTAVVQGDVITPGGGISRDPAAQVLGNQVANVAPRAFDGDFNWGGSFSPVWQVIQVLAMTAFALVIVLLMPTHVENAADTIAAKPAIAGGLGLLSVALLVPAFVITFITCVLPVAIVFSMIAAMVFGWVALGFEVGRRMDTLFKGEWTPLVQAVLGTLTISLANSFFALIPCVGMVPGFLAGMVGLGATILSRFGTQPLVPEMVAVLPAPRKPATKKSAAKKTATKKAAANKPAAKKSAARKSSKPVAKKAAVKKTVAKKSTRPKSTSSE